MTATVLAIVLVALVTGIVIGWLIGGRSAAAASQTVDNLRLQLDEVVKERDANRDAATRLAALEASQAERDRGFEARIKDWEPHLQQMFAFWSSVALMSGRYHGTPMVKHMRLPVDAAHFDRWLALFEQTAREICPPAAEAHFVERARRIAASLELGIAGGQGVMLGNGERFRRNQAGAV